MDDTRLKLLEQRVQVLQQEINAVLGEVQDAVVALMKTNEITITAIYNRLDEIEELLGEKKPEIRSDNGGHEL